ncbi:MAG: hypothetical protein PWQ29_936 [Verrucomicrobiota bacterium]|jgi:hypothetical protein|nr:hypothetical protein [Verrucomicrobiota bacterium]MDK2963542.1 hypothetical protein [Verrucomicrobiota bacterium]
MKKYWYLVASLPYLHLGEKPSMDAAGFLAACAGHLSDDEMSVVKAVLENREPPPGAASLLWNSEVQLRDAVVRVRAKNRSIDAARFLRPYEGFSATLEKMVADAFTRPNPLEQEMEIDRARWALADELALSDPFGFPAVLAFAVKVRLADRWAGMDDKAAQQKVEELIEEVLTEGRKEHEDA